MKASLNFLTVGVLIALAACSTQEVKRDTPAPAAVVPPPAAQPDKTSASGQNPAMTLDKGGKRLHLVRIMDGLACKNTAQGAQGSFLIYAYPEDIERIKRERGDKVFAEFSDRIQAFSADVLQQAVNATNLDDNPFALGQDEAQEALAKDLSVNFQRAVAPAIAKFTQETTLTIDITPFTPSLQFYRQSCQAALSEPVAPETSVVKP
jgi:hypothetical protein